MKNGLEPLKQWNCDRCREIIPSAEAGYLEWLDDEDHRTYGFKIIHGPTSSPRKQGNCYHYTDVTTHDFSSGSLDTFVGKNGIAHLLAFLDPGRVLDIREWTTLFRRLHLPYYEEALPYWSEADSDGFFADANQVSPYTQDSLKTIIETFGKDG